MFEQMPTVSGADGCDQLVDDGRDDAVLMHRGTALEAVFTMGLVMDYISLDVIKWTRIGELPFSVINVNNYKMKFKNDNVCGCRSDARVFVAECDRICALQVCMDGIQNNPINENIGHFDKENDRAEDLERMKIDNRMLQVDCSDFPGGGLLFCVIDVNDAPSCMEGTQNNTIDESIGHSYNEIDRADMEGLEGMKIGDIMPKSITSPFPMDPIQSCWIQSDFWHIILWRFDCAIFIIFNGGGDETVAGSG